jgi:hypothetical protein
MMTSRVLLSPFENGYVCALERLSTLVQLFE